MVDRVPTAEDQAVREEVSRAAAPAVDTALRALVRILARAAARDHFEHGTDSEHAAPQWRARR